MAERDRSRRRADRRRAADDRLDPDRAGPHRARNERMERLSGRPRRRARDRYLAELQGGAQRRQAVGLGGREPPAGARSRKRRARAVGDRGLARRRRDIDGQAGQADPLCRAVGAKPLRSRGAERRAHPLRPRRGARGRRQRTRQTPNLSELASDLVRHGRVRRWPGRADWRQRRQWRADHDRACRRHRMGRAQRAARRFRQRASGAAKAFRSTPRRPSR